MLAISSPGCLSKEGAQNNGWVFLQFTELMRCYKLLLPHPCIIPHPQYFCPFRKSVGDGCIIASQGASKAHGAHHIVLSCRWTPHGPCWGSGETPACCAKLSLHPDIKTAHWVAHIATLKYTGQKCHGDALVLTLRQASVTQA